MRNLPLYFFFKTPYDHRFIFRINKLIYNNIIFILFHMTEPSFNKNQFNKKAVMFNKKSNKINNKFDHEYKKMFKIKCYV